ncbi:hypothetical protein FO519_005272 [Halicephalobus sp. NKZ332]|nr:hypothetical protein FO519_005272 [Halicephalobus sp. NKZ332]
MAEVENVAPVEQQIAEPEAKRQKVETLPGSVHEFKVPFVKLSEAARPPFRGSEFAAGADLHAAEACTIPVHGKRLVSTGLKVALPSGTYGRVAPRSGLAFKNQVDVGAGVVDEDYRGEVKVLLFNFGSADFEVKEGDRIAQLVCQEISSSLTNEFPQLAKETVEVRLADDLATLPTKQGAGVVIHSSQDGSVAPGQMVTLSTGVHVALPAGYYGRVAILNKLAIESSLKIFAGVIDEDYRGEIKILLFNHGDSEFKITRGDAIGQLICEKIGSCTYELAEELTETERGEGGFGSTGTSAVEAKEDDGKAPEQAITWTKLTEDAQDPVYGSRFAAGADLFAAKEYTVAPGKTALVSTGLKINVKPGHYARVAPRSGLAVKNFIDIGAGVYNDGEELLVLMFNHGTEAFTVNKGDRVAQLVAERIADINVERVEELSETKRADIGMGHTPALDATHGTFLPTGPDDSFQSGRFYYRMYNVLQAVMEMSSFWFIVPKIVGYDSPRKLTSVKFDTSEVMIEAEMQLRDGFDRIGRIVPHGNDFRSIGSHCGKIPSLEGEFKDFVEDENSKGTIYLAFGSILDFDNCPEFVFNALFSALNEFRDYKVVMSMKPLKNRTLPFMNDHIKITPWVPQYALLSHRKTKLFMSHGGLKSFKEALCSKTPVLFLPVFAEQGLNARNAIRLGIGSALNKYTITKDQIVREFNRASFI